MLTALFIFLSNDWAWSDQAPTQEAPKTSAEKLAEKSPEKSPEKSAFRSQQIKMAITFDDLPTHGRLPQGTSRVEIVNSVLATLKKFAVPEVYGFINAKKCQEEAGSCEVLKLWVNGGYPLGNHTYSHKSLNKVSAEEFLQDLTDNEKTLAEMGSSFDWHYFRYPFLHEGDNLEKRNKVRKHLKEEGYTIAQVTDDFEDWAWNNPYARCKDKKDLASVARLRMLFLRSAMARLELDKAISDKLFGRPIYHVLLLHLGAFDAEILPELLQAYKDKGVEFVGLAEAAKDPVFNQDPGIFGKDDDFPFQVLKARGLTLKDLGLTDKATPLSELRDFCKK